MFSNKDVIPVQDYRIDTYPSLKELSEYTQKALQVRGMKHVYIWEDKEVHKTFKLAMLAKQGIPEMEWWLHEDSVVGSRMIWFYKTKDMHLIFANMCEAVGAPASLHEEEIEAHRQHEVELRGRALVRPLERVEDLHVDLGAVEGAVARVERPGGAGGRRVLVERLGHEHLRAVPHVDVAEEVLGPGSG